MQHDSGRGVVIFDVIEWDEHNLDYACRRLSAVEIEQVLANAMAFRRHRVHRDRIVVVAETDGGRRATVIAHIDEARGAVRPITGWEER